MADAHQDQDGLSVDVHCEILAATIRDRTNGSMEGFKLFGQLFSAIAGGTIALRLQFPAFSKFIWLSDCLAILVAVICSMIISENVRSWTSYRTRLSEVAGPDVVPLPNISVAGRVWRAMYVVIGIATVAFVILNHTV